MSYSISVKAPSKQAALQSLAAKFDAEVLPGQPVHAADRDQALAAATAFVSLLKDQDAADVFVQLSGSLGWASVSEFTSANVHVSAYFVVREA